MSKKRERGNGKDEFTEINGLIQDLLRLIADREHLQEIQDDIVISQ